MSALPAGTEVDGLTLRPVTEADTGVLLDLFCQDRAPVLLRMQFKALQHHLASSYPQALDHVLELHGRPVGRLVVSRLARRGEAGQLRVVDLVIDRRERRKGLGTAALRPWLEQARQQLIPVTLRVGPDDAARNFYSALGFRPDPERRSDQSPDLPMRLDPRPDRERRDGPRVH